MNFLPLLIHYTKYKQVIGDIVFLTIISIISFYTAFLSPAFGESLSSRIEYIWWVLIPLFPIWLTDDTVKTDGPIQVFLHPRNNLIPLIYSILASRVLRALFLALIIGLIIVNLSITLMSIQVLLVLFCTLFSLMALISFLGLFASLFTNGKFNIVLCYLIFFFLQYYYNRSEGLANTLVGYLLFPGWLLEPDSSFFIFSLCRAEVLQVFSSLLFWWLLISFIFIRRYR